METITNDDYLKALSKDEYYRGRWGYYEAVIDFIKGIEFENCLEIGCKSLPIIKGSQTMDIERKTGQILTYEYNATKLPYDFIKDKQFDLLVALQTLEHLHPMQKEVFGEWKRIAKNIVISLPYMWHCPNDVMHHNITIPMIEEWTGMKPDKMTISNCRIILKYGL